MANSKSKTKAKTTNKTKSTYEKVVLNNKDDETRFMKSKMPEFFDKYKQCASQATDKCKDRNGLWLKSDFFKSKTHEEFDGYFPICKDCFNHFVLTEEGNLSKKGLTKILPIFNTPFLVSRYQNALDSDSNSKGGIYMKAVQFNDYDLRFVDSDSEVLKISMEIDNGYDPSNIVIDDELYLKWGAYHEKNEIISLEYNYNRYTQQYQIEGMVEENMVKQLCYIELDMEKARMASKPTKDLQKQWTDTLTSLKLKPDQQNKDSNKYTRLGNIAELIEQGEPIVEEDPAFTDVDNMTWYINNFFSQIFSVFGKSKIKKEKPKLKNKDGVE